MSESNPRRLDRPEPRSEPRADAHENPRAAAERRAQELLNGGSLDNINEPDEYYIDPKYIRDGWSWEWKRYSVLNELQTSHINALKRTGWEFVSPSHYPLIEPNAAGVVVYRGNALMERPLSITNMMEERDRKLAKLQMDTKAGQVEGVDPSFSKSNKGEPIRSHGVAGPKTSYSPMRVPE
jgi:hypothetical protein